MSVSRRWPMVETFTKTRVVKPVEIADGVSSQTEIRVETKREWHVELQAVVSLGERMIAGILEDLSDRFVTEKSFKDLRGVGGGLRDLTSGSRTARGTC